MPSELGTISWIWAVKRPHRANGGETSVRSSLCHSSWRLDCLWFNQNTRNHHKSYTQPLSGTNHLSPTVFVTTEHYMACLIATI